MPQHNTFVIGASAGGVEPLMQILRKLPADFPGSVFVVLHTLSGGGSQLPRLLNRVGLLQAIHPADGMSIEPGIVYVASSNHHLAIENGVVRSFIGPRQSGHRPSINVLFESAAAYRGEQVVGIVLSGALDDGTAGLVRIKQAGGLAIVQSPEEAAFPSMPYSAITNLSVDQIASADEIGDLMIDIAFAGSTSSGIREESGMPKDREESAPLRSPRQELQLSRVYGFSCPDCGGVLGEEQLGELAQFRCHTGHRYSESALLNGQGEVLENALWTALRVLQERIDMLGRLAERSRSHGNVSVAQRFEARQAEARGPAAVLQRVLVEDDVAQRVFDFQVEDAAGTGEPA